jgi:hypothetical protein
MAVVRTTRLACHREFRRSGSEKILPPRCTANHHESNRRRASPRIESPRVALSSSAFVRVLPPNPKKGGTMSASQAIKHARAVR